MTVSVPDEKLRIWCLRMFAKALEKGVQAQDLVLLQWAGMAADGVDVSLYALIQVTGLIRDELVDRLQGLMDRGYVHQNEKLGYELTSLGSKLVKEVWGE